MIQRDHNYILGQWLSQKYTCLNIPTNPPALGCIPTIHSKSNFSQKKAVKGQNSVCASGMLLQMAFTNVKQNETKIFLAAVLEFFFSGSEEKKTCLC